MRIRINQGADLPGGEEERAGVPRVVHVHPDDPQGATGELRYGLIPRHVTDASGGVLWSRSDRSDERDRRARVG